MFGLSVSEMLLYGGIALMILAVVLAVVFAIVFHNSEKKLQQKLREEYGDPAHYHDAVKAAK